MRLEAGQLTHRHQPPAARMPRPTPEPGTRWRASPVTFGPVGRVLATLALCGVPILVLATMGAPLIPFVGIWLCFIPLGLRDIWRPVRVNSSTDRADT